MYLLALEKILPILVKLQLGNLNIGRVDGNIHLGAVGLLLHDSVDVDAVPAAINRRNLASRLLGKLATHNLNFVLLTHRKRADLHATGQARDF